MQSPTVRLLKPSTASLLAILVMAGTCPGCDTTEPKPVSRVLWKSDGQGWGTPTFDETNAYFVGRDHELFAVNKASGVRLWRSVTGETGGETFGINAVSVGSIVAMGDRGIHAFNKSNGASAWHFHGPTGTNPGYYEIATDGTKIYGGSTDGSVTAVSAATGQQVWRTQVSATTSTSVVPTMAPAGLFACLHRTNTLRSTGGIVALDPSTGTIRWTFEFPQTLPTQEAGCYLSPVVSGDLVIGATQDGSIYAVDATTGLQRWSAPQISGTPPNQGSPLADLRPLAISGDVVAAGSTTGYVVALRLADGTEKWRATANRGSVIYPLAADATGIYANHAGQVAAFEAADGKLRFLVGDATPGSQAEFVYAAAVDADRLFIAGFTGLFALRKQ